MPENIKAASQPGSLLGPPAAIFQSGGRYLGPSRTVISLWKLLVKAELQRRLLSSLEIAPCILIVGGPAEARTSEVTELLRSCGLNKPRTSVRFLEVVEATRGVYHTSAQSRALGLGDVPLVLRICHARAARILP